MNFTDITEIEKHVSKEQHIKLIQKTRDFVIVLAELIKFLPNNSNNKKLKSLVYQARYYGEDCKEMAIWARSLLQERLRGVIINGQHLVF